MTWYGTAKTDEKIKCTPCDGTGQLTDDDDSDYLRYCPICDGNGWTVA